LDVMTMGYSHDCPTGRTEPGALPGREDLRSGISDLRSEIRRLQEAVISHAVIDQAIGVVIAMGGLRPDQGIEVLTAVSRRTGMPLPEIAGYIVDWTATERLPGGLRQALDTALAAVVPAGAAATARETTFRARPRLAVVRGLRIRRQAALRGDADTVGLFVTSRRPGRV
jgi:hypothetical protein